MKQIRKNAKNELLLQDDSLETRHRKKNAIVDGWCQCHPRNVLITTMTLYYSQSLRISEYHLLNVSLAQIYSSNSSESVSFYE